MSVFTDRMRERDIKDNKLVEEIKEEDVDKKWRFKDIIGHDDEKELLLEMANYWKHKTKYGTPKGLLLFGYPGCGKTALLEALFNEVNEDEIYMKEMLISDITAYVGTTASKVENYFVKLYKEAKGRQIILVMDEAEQMMPSKDKGLNDIVGERVSALLKEVDGYQDDKDIIFLLTSNHPGKIETAFLRAGRVGFKIQIQLPTEEERHKLVNMYFTHIRGINERKMKLIFEYTPKWTGADYAQFSGLLENYQESMLDINPDYMLTSQDLSKRMDFVEKHTKKNFKKFEEEYKKYNTDEE